MKPTRLRTAISSVVFWGWAVALFVVATGLGAAHLHALPKPAKTDSTLAHALNGLRAPSEQTAWLAVHVLYAQCRCSRGILEHLASSARPAEVREKVLLVGSNPEIAASLHALVARSFQVVEVGAAELRDRYHVQAAPLFVVLGPEGTIRYSGGYTQRKQGPSIQDRTILGELMSQNQPSELPVLGCAVSEELRRLLDPLALKTSTP